MNYDNNQKRFLKAAAILTTVYLCAVFLGVPLIFSNLYFNITETKHTVFLVLSGGYLLLLLFARIAFPPDYGVRLPRVQPHPAVFALVALFVFGVVGALLSQYPDEVFWGQNNRYQGLLTLCTYAVVVFALSYRTIDLGWSLRALALGASLASLLGLLNHFGLDPFGFYTNLRAADQGRFLSTLGNADFYGAYLVLVFPVVLGLFIHAERLRARLLATLALVSVCFGTLVAGSDSAALGLIVVALAFPLLLFGDARAMRRLALGWGIFFLSAFVFGLLSGVLPSATYLSYFTSALSRAVFSLPLAAASFALWLLLGRAGQERLLRLKKPYWITLCAAFGLGLIALVLLNTVLAELSIGSLSRYLRFSASWGTDRGKIWTFVMHFYTTLSPAQKLFGAGSGALFHADSVKPLFSDAALDTAHNEYLQYLVTNGALGLLSYLAAIVLALRTGIRRSVEQPVFRGIVIAVLAYAAQAVVNIAQPASTPLFFVLLGLLVSRPPELQPPDQAA